MSSSQFFNALAIAFWVWLFTTEFRTYLRRPLKAERRAFLRWELGYRWGILIVIPGTLVLAYAPPVRGDMVYVMMLINIIVCWVILMAMRKHIEHRIEFRGFAIVPRGQVWVRHESWIKPMSNRYCWYNAGSFYLMPATETSPDLWEDRSRTLYAGDRFVWHKGNDAWEPTTIVNRSYGRGVVVRPWKFWLPRELRQAQKASA